MTRELRVDRCLCENY